MEDIYWKLLFIETDYKNTSLTEAKKVMGHFFKGLMFHAVGVS